MSLTLNVVDEKKYIKMGWFVCGLAALYYCYEYLLRVTPSVMEGPLRDHYNLSASGFGFLSAFYYYAYVPMQIPVGILLDRYGPRLLLTAACFICVTGTYLFAGTSIFWVAALGRFLVGFGSAFAFVGVLKLGTIWLPEDKLAMIAGLTSALGTVGAMLGDNIMAYFVVTVGWLETVNWSAFIGVVLMIVLWFGIHDRKKYQRQSGTVSNFHKSFIDLLVIARSPQTWINGLIGCLVYLPTTVFAELWGIPYLQHAHGLSPQAAGFANSLIFFGFMVGAPLMGFLSDHFKQRKLPLLVGAVGAALIMIIILYLPGLTEVHVDILLFLLGLFYSSQCIVFAIGRELSPEEAAGTAMAMVNMIVMLGAMILQPLVGRLLDFSFKHHTSAGLLNVLSVEKFQQMYTAFDYQYALSVIPIGIIVAAILTFFLKETHANTV